MQRCWKQEWRVICKTFTVRTGYLEFIQEKLFSGQLSYRLVMGCVDNKALNGDYETNPFNFQRFSVSEISVYLDVQQHAIKPLVIGLYKQSVCDCFQGNVLWYP